MSSDAPMDKQRRLTRFDRWRRLALKPKPAIGLALLLSALLAWRALSSTVIAGSANAQHLSIATVERGAMLLDLRAAGQLLPSEQLWIGAQSEGRVERLLVQPGAEVRQGQALLDMSNAQLRQRMEENRWQLEQGEAELKALRVSLESLEMNQQAAVQRAEYSASSAHLQWDADQELLKDGMVSKLNYQRSAFNVKQMDQALALERGQLDQLRRNMRAQLDARQAVVARLQKTLQRDQDLVAALMVRAPIDGVVQELLPQPGQTVLAGANLARIAQAGALYAEILVPEAMARDVQAGQQAQIDLRTGSADGVLPAVVMRVAPKVSNGVVKVSLGLSPAGRAWPRGARPDLSVDGRIEIARLDDTLKVDRPLFSQARSQASVFRVDKNGIARRIPVQFGPASISQIAISQGLAVGDRIVVSDTTRWQQLDSVRIE